MWQSFVGMMLRRYRGEESPVSDHRFRVCRFRLRDVLATAAITLALVACGGSDADNGSNDTSGGDAPSAANEAQSIFIEQGCAECHGEQGEGSGEPRTEIAGTRMIIQAFTTRVRNGRGAAMPGYSEEQVSDEEIELLHDWLRTN
jgi:mono/diheme cytochrome c family protein